MKIALVHDYIKEYGGAERVLEALHEIWPHASVYTSIYLPEFLGPHKHRFDSWDIQTSWLQNIPFVEKLISPSRIFTPSLFSHWDFSQYDVVIVSATGAYFPNLIQKEKAVHICYCHTPPRYLYGYPTARNWQKNALGRFCATILNHRLRLIDFSAAQNPDYFIANSLEIKQRIKKFYRRDATIIYPPVEMVDRLKHVDTQKKTNTQKDYYLTGGRLARAKRIDVAIEACNTLGLPLKIFGKSFAGYEQELRNIAGPTVEFLGEVTEDRLLDLYQGAKALLYMAEFEDFGIMPVEAMACGLPVIALKQGGVIETVIEGKTGLFIPENTVQHLVSAIKKFQRMNFKREDCQSQAQKFSKERFQKEIKEFILSHARTSRS